MEITDNDFKDTEECVGASPPPHFVAIARRSAGYATQDIYFADIWKLVASRVLKSSIRSTILID
jgi:hypothetical protein